MSKSVCEEEVFKSIYTKNAESLINFMYYKCGDYSGAEDLIQEAFVRLWKECTNVSMEKSKSFLYTVAKNLFLNQVKHKKVVFNFEQRRHSQLNNLTPQFLLEEAEFKERLEAAIAALPEGQRTVFLMNRIDKLTYREIAEILDLSVKAIEKRMHNALKSLHKISTKL